MKNDTWYIIRVQLGVIINFTAFQPAFSLVF